MNYYEEIVRHYSNGVKIVYEILDNENIYISSIISINKKQGRATESLNVFIKDFKDYNLFIFATNELGTNREILYKWYKRLGFKEYNNIDYIPYNVTHAIINK
ncbi:hypothetical protein FC831_15230 [Clostridium botulinum]|nr:hypothetical protein [Clostridium botulinum]